MELHANIREFSELVGTWSGQGRGIYPTIQDFSYNETLIFTAIPGKPFLRYLQLTTSPEGAPMHTESGFLRFVGDDNVEFVIAQPTGQTELLIGIAHPAKGVLDFTESTVANSPTAKTVDVTRRHYHITSNETQLVTRFDMAAVGQHMTNHLQSTLTKQTPTSAGATA